MATPRSSTDLTADADEQSGRSEEMPPPPPPVDPSPAAHQVSAVSVKLPPFWPTDPQLWFAQVEAQFRTRSITREETKFWHVVGTLEQKYANEVRDLLLEPPASNPYTVLKTQLVARLTASAHQRVRQLLSDEPLGDRKPSQFLRHLQHLQGDAKIDKSILTELFLQRLPASVRMVLATASSLSPEEQAKLADNILDISSPSVVSPSISAVADRPASACVPTEVEKLRADIAALRVEVANLSRSRSRSRSHSRGRSHSNTRGRSTSPNRSGLCYYHERFGSDARKCRQTCSFSPPSGNGPASQ